MRSKLSWQEQLANAKKQLNGQNEHYEHYDESIKADVNKQESTHMKSSNPFSPGKQEAQGSRPHKPGPSSDSVKASDGRLNMKSSAGEFSIPISDPQQQELAKQVLEFQRTIIREKKASIIATYAMALLSGLTAVAVGATMIKSATSKSNTPTIQ